MRKLMIMGLITLFTVAITQAEDSRYCQQTTKKCGSTVKKPLAGYGDQRSGCKKDLTYDNRCGGCGKTIQDK